MAVDIRCGLSSVHIDTLYVHMYNCLKFQTRDIKVSHFNKCVLSSDYIICRNVYKLVERIRGKGGGGSGVQPAPPPSRCNLYESVCVIFVMFHSFSLIK